MTEVLNQYPTNHFEIEDESCEKCGENLFYSRIKEFSDKSHHEQIRCANCERMHRTHFLGNWRQMIRPHGKYRGKTLEWILNKDRRYLEIWLNAEGIDENGLPNAPQGHWEKAVKMALGYSLHKIKMEDRKVMNPKEETKGLDEEIVDKIIDGLSVKVNKNGNVATKAMICIDKIVNALNDYMAEMHKIDPAIVPGWKPPEEPTSND